MSEAVTADSESASLEVAAPTGSTAPTEGLTPTEQPAQRDGAQPDRIAQLEAEVASLRAQLDAAWAQLQGMRTSLSWRITYPLRVIRRRWPR